MMFITKDGKEELVEMNDPEIYAEALRQMDERYPYKCICGRLATGLHTNSCKKFQLALYKTYLKIQKAKKFNKN